MIIIKANSNDMNYFKESLLFSMLLLWPALSRAQDYRVPVSETQEKMITGLYQPTWESLESQYQVPEWFRDAKFGI